MNANPATAHRHPLDGGRPTGGVLGRLLALGALLAAATSLLVLLATGRSEYTVRVQLVSASHIAKGSVVRIAGREVGTVSKTELTQRRYAQLTLKLDPDVAPLRQGTEAQLRLASLSGAAGAYVDLRIPPAGGNDIPDGGLIPVEHTQSIVNVDQFFSIFDAKTRKGLTRVVRGSGKQFDSVEDLVDAGWRQLNPAFVSSSRLFDELNRNSRDLRLFLKGSARLVGALAQRRDDISVVVDRLATTTGAIARRERSLSSAIALAPSFLRRSNTTFSDLRSALNDLDPLVAAAKPVAPRLNALLGQLQPLSHDARTPVRQLATAVRTPGTGNDLTDLGRATLPLRDIMVRSGIRDGRTRRGSLPEATEAFRRSTPMFAFWRPYGPDIVAFLKAFSALGIYDANGIIGRAATLPGAFESTNGRLGALVPAPQRQAYIDRATVKQRNRCPGSAELPAADGSNPWRPSSGFDCNPTQVRPGQ